LARLTLSALVVLLWLKFTVQLPGRIVLDLLSVAVLQYLDRLFLPTLCDALSLITSGSDLHLATTATRT